MAQPEPHGPSTPLNQKSWGKKSPGPVAEEFAAREVTDVFRSIAAHGGGAASFDLALDLVLNQVVEQARLATGATGSAIALERAGEMVCRATSGADAPELGVRLDLNSGLSGACLQTGSIQRCSDTENDPRVNAEDCRRLGVRSIVMLPLESMAEGSERFGILQAFSSWPNAFSDRDVNTLQALARRVVENVVENKGQATAGTLEAGVANVVPSVVPSVERAVAGRSLDMDSSADIASRVDEPLQPMDAGDSAKQAAPAESTVRLSSEASAETSASKSVWTSVLGVLVIVVAVALGLAMGWRAGLGRGLRGAQATNASGVSANQGSDSSGQTGTGSVVPEESTVGNVSGSPARTSGAESSAEPPSGGLLVTENGRVIYRLPAGNGVGSGATTKKSKTSGTRLIHRVEPEYPTEATAKNIQGVVTLEVQIGTDGVVHNITVVNGEAQLADAAVQAVRQWRYEPYRVNGRAVEMETRVTIRFTLPGS